MFNIKSVFLVYADGFKILLLPGYFITSIQNFNTHLAKCFIIHKCLNEHAWKPLKRVSLDTLGLMSTYSLNTLELLYACSLNMLKDFPAHSPNTLGNVTISMRVQGTHVK
jgi:hypothetical protein